MSYLKADKTLIDKYMKEADALKAEIENSLTTVEVTGTKYYVSADGNDANDGTSPETAWKTIEKVNNTMFSYGDGVFFRRGDSWRITNWLNAKKGMTYSAYGEGSKPKLICSVDASDKNMWIQTEYKNIYRYDEKLNCLERDVGCIIFDSGKCWGIKIEERDNGERLDVGRVYNGLEWFDVTSAKFDGYKDLKHNLEYYHDWESGYLYLYSKEGNPGEVFDSIELADKGHGIFVGNAMDLTIDNIEIYGTGSHGIAGHDMHNVTVQYCTLKWIGGSTMGRRTFGRDHDVRYGNAVESYGSSDNFVIHHCYAAHVYDCCWTVQIFGPAIMRNIKMHHNLSEFCNTGLEVWQRFGLLTNMDLYDNITRFNGYGWSHQRPAKDSNFNYGANGLARVSHSNHIRNNINLFCSVQSHYARATGKDHYNFHDNIYFMEEGKLIGGICEKPWSSEGNWPTHTPYDEENVNELQEKGFEPGSIFYITEKEPFGKNMYALCTEI